MWCLGAHLPSPSDIVGHETGSKNRAGSDGIDNEASWKRRAMEENSRNESIEIPHLQNGLEGMDSVCPRSQNHKKGFANHGKWVRQTVRTPQMGVPITPRPF